ncbi:MAG TPA: anthranilate phosphoribosyltransferase [Microbacteriaceae bacterium]|nr:anthranilate phosphoribosyltransferase [Microbacteriaceae bacterium]
MAENRAWSHILTALLDGSDLSIGDAAWAMNEVISGAATPAQLAGFLIALRAKGESVNEIVGFRDAVLQHAVALPVPAMALDIVGTGGDRHRTINVSTSAAIVCAASGVPVVKHGNRAASSSSGASDVLGALGLDISHGPERIATILERVGLTYVNASVFHPGFRHVAGVRAELGVPSVFNFLGPMCNPARPEAQAVGVAQLDRVPLFTGVFQTRGATALVFRGDDGLDELTTTGHSHVWEVSRGTVKEHDIDPRELGIPRATLEDLRGGTPEENARVVRAVLAGERGPARDIVLLNAAAGLVSFRLAEDPSRFDESILERLHAALATAAEAVDSGAAAAKLDEWIAASAA